MWNNAVSQDEERLLDTLSASLSSIDYAELCSMNSQHIFANIPTNTPAVTMFPAEKQQNHVSNIASAEGQCDDHFSSEQEDEDSDPNDQDQADLTQKASKSRVSSVKRKNRNKEVASKTRQQKKVNFATLKARMYLLKQDNQKLREAAISRLPRSASVVSLLNNSFQIPFEVVALMREYAASEQNDTASVTSTTTRAESQMSCTTATEKSGTTFGLSMEENISFCILDATSTDLRIKYASLCYCSIVGATSLIGSSFRDLPGPVSNVIQFASLRDALRDGRSASVNVMHYGIDGSQRTMMVNLVYPKVQTSRVPFMIARQVGSSCVRRPPVLPFTVGSTQSLTAYSSTGSASKSGSTKIPRGKSAALHHTAAALPAVTEKGGDRSDVRRSGSFAQLSRTSSSNTLTSTGSGSGDSGACTASKPLCTAHEPRPGVRFAAPAALPIELPVRGTAPAPYVSGRMLAEFLVGPEVLANATASANAPSDRGGDSASMDLFRRADLPPNTQGYSLQGLPQQRQTHNEHQGQGQYFQGQCGMPTQQQQLQQQLQQHQIDFLQHLFKF